MGTTDRQTKREAYRASLARDGSIALPKKKFYRQRAHANPFSDHNLIYPASPAQMDWRPHFPGARDPNVTIADIGCGFGGLLVALAPLMPDRFMVGMELRGQVTEYVVSRIAALRSQNPGGYGNITALRTNTMKFLANYFEKGALDKVFLCFPDPHFKQRKHKARIVSSQLAAEYGFVVAEGGKLYTITDVEELHSWMVAHFVGPEAGDVAELWERVSDAENETDEYVRVMRDETEEGKKVTRNNGRKYLAVFRRRANPPWPDEN